MATAYCPHCRQPTSPRITFVPARGTPKGEEAARRILHCGRCHGFIRSEEVDAAAAGE